MRQEILLKESPLREWRDMYKKKRGHVTKVNMAGIAHFLATQVMIFKSFLI